MHLLVSKKEWKERKTEGYEEGLEDGKRFTFKLESTPKIIQGYLDTVNSKISGVSSSDLPANAKNDSLTILCAQRDVLAGLLSLLAREHGS
jgi:hypothetical protein